MWLFTETPAYVHHVGITAFDKCSRTALNLRSLTSLLSPSQLLFPFFKKNFTNLFLERGRDGERE